MFDIKIEISIEFCIGIHLEKLTNKSFRRFLRRNQKNDAWKRRVSQVLTFRRPGFFTVLVLVDHRGPNFNENRFMDIRLEVKTTTYTTWIGRVATVEVMVPCASQVLTTAGTILATLVLIPLASDRRTLLRLISWSRRSFRMGVLPCSRRPVSWLKRRWTDLVSPSTFKCPWLRRQSNCKWIFLHRL